MSIENTTLNGDRGWILGRGPKAIEDQEAEGQRQLAADSALPSQGLDDVAAEFGITIHGQRPNDLLFTDVTLPDGWWIRPTDHSMWSDLIDERGEVRAEIFYKAAYYDRGAFIRKVTR